MILLAGGYDIAAADMEAIAKQHSIPVSRMGTMGGNVNLVLRKADPLLKHGLRLYHKPSGEIGFFLVTQNGERREGDFEYVEGEHDRRIKDRFVHHGNLNAIHHDFEHLDEAILGEPFIRLWPLALVV